MNEDKSEINKNPQILQKWLKFKMWKLLNFEK